MQVGLVVGSHASASPASVELAASITSEAQFASAKGSHEVSSAHGNYGVSSQVLTPYQPVPSGPNVFV